MYKRLLTISLHTALFTAGIIVLYQASNLLLVYKYFPFDYYLAIAVFAALLAGVWIARKYPRTGAGKSNLPKEQLTNKELKILALISDGKTNKEIAVFYFIEVSTVKTHINNIYGKLGVANRKQAADWYFSNYQTQKSTLFPPAAN